MERTVVIETLQKKAPKVHCLTNPVTMQDVANILLAAGGSAIMAQNPEEAADITALCHATLLNTGVPDAEKFRACILAGKRANELGHPVVLDPVGVGASAYRKREMQVLLKEVQMSVIRCNQEEAFTLLSLGEEKSDPPIQEGGRISGGVESAVSEETEKVRQLAVRIAKMYSCTVLISGVSDVISDGEQIRVLSGGDDRMRRITGSGCMLSALCALFCGTGLPVFDAVCATGEIWKQSSEEAGEWTDRHTGGIGSFHVALFDALDQLCHVQDEMGTDKRS